MTTTLNERSGGPGRAEAERRAEPAARARPQPADRWGGTPLTDAEGNGHTHVAELIRQAAQPAERKVAI